MKSKYQTFVTVQIKQAKIEATLEIMLENWRQNLKCYCIKKEHKTKEKHHTTNLTC